MTAPVVVLTDHLDSTSGDINMEVGHAWHFECVSGSTIGEGGWIQAKIEWSVNDTGADYITDIRGFNFSHYFATTGTFVVTCTVTNVNGESDTETRTVIVGASTRTTVVVNDGDNLKTVHDANAGDNKEFVISGTVTVNAAILPNDNNVFRSATPGTLVNVDWTGSSASLFNLASADNAITWKDLHFRQGGASRSTSIIEHDGTNNNVINCTVDAGVCSGQMLNGATDPKGWLIQDCTTTHDSGGQNIWVGNGINTRMLAVYGGSHVANADNSERALRGYGIYVAIVDSYLEQANVANAKDVMSINGGSFRYAYRSQFINSTASGTGTVLLTGHTSGTIQVSDIVFDRCYLGFSNRGGTWRVGVNNQGSVIRMTIRNCVIRSSTLSIENAADLYLHHNTHNNPAGGLRWLYVNPGNLTATNIVATGNLSVWGSTITESILITSVTDTASEFVSLNNNITGTPSQEDVDINDSVNGNKDETWTTFNARSNADGNLRKAITIDGSYRPTDLEDTDLLCTPATGLSIFAEDYHGNARSGQWHIGAVGPVSSALWYAFSNASGTIFVRA